MIGKRLLEIHMPQSGKVLMFKTKKYFIFSDGRCFDNSRKRFLKQWVSNTGYLNVGLTTDNGKNTSIGVHVLVASVFQRLLCKGEVVHHISHVKSDNRLENLEIIDIKEHTRQHSIENWRNGTFDGIGEKAKKAWADGAHKGHGEKVAEKLRNIGSSRPAKPVAQLDKDERLLRVWPSTAEAGRNGYNFTHVSECCRGELKSHHGFKWIFYEDYLAQQPTAKLRWNARKAYYRVNEKFAAKLSKRVAQLDLNGRLLRVWPSTAEAGRNGFHNGAVSACCRNCFNRPGNNIYKNFKWMWYSEYLSSQPTKEQQFEARQIYLNFTD